MNHILPYNNCELLLVPFIPVRLLPSPTETKQGPGGQTSGTSTFACAQNEFMYLIFVMLMSTTIAVAAQCLTCVLQSRCRKREIVVAAVPQRCRRRWCPMQQQSTLRCEQRPSWSCFFHERILCKAAYAFLETQRRPLYAHTLVRRSTLQASHER